MGAADDATSPETSPNCQGKPRKWGDRHPAVKAAIITGICTLIAATISATAVLHHTQATGPQASPAKHPPPSVTITSPHQGAHIGLDIIVTGTVAHLRPDQVIAVFIQPYENGAPTNRFWPALGPAARGPQGAWSCDIQVGPATRSAGREFAIWAVLVTSAESYTDNHTEQENRYFTYPASTDVPHVAGTRLAHRVVARS